MDLPFTFLIDTDDVLSLFCPRIYGIMDIIKPDWRKRLPDDEWDIFSVLHWQERDVLEAVMSAPGFCSKFQTTPGSWEFIATVRQLGGDVYALTAPNHFPNWASERVQWLSEKYVILPDHVVLTHAKHMVHGDFMLDDRPEHVIKWAKAHPEGVAMLWTTDHNARIQRGSEYRVNGFAEVLQKIRARL